MRANAPLHVHVSTLFMVLILVVVSGVAWRHVRQEHPVEDAVPETLCNMFSTAEFSEDVIHGVFHHPIRSSSRRVTTEMTSGSSLRRPR